MNDCNSSGSPFFTLRVQFDAVNDGDDGDEDSSVKEYVSTRIHGTAEENKLARTHRDTRISSTYFPMRWKLCTGTNNSYAL